MPTLTDKIDLLLPQTQCQQCGYPRCYEYASAIAEGGEKTNRCPPGGHYTREKLAALLHTQPLELDPDCGIEAPRLLYTIREASCIGCTLCIQACPVDAIIGAAKRMHTVLANECTGCGLCVPVCPVDCIDSAIHPAANANDGHQWPGFTDIEIKRARRRTNARLQRLARQQQESRKSGNQPQADRIREEIAAAVKRVRKKRNTP